MADQTRRDQNPGPGPGPGPDSGLCAQLGVFTVPTIFVYAEGSLTVRESGYFGLEGVLRKVEQYESML